MEKKILGGLSILYITWDDEELIGKEEVILKFPDAQGQSEKVWRNGEYCIHATW